MVSALVLAKELEVSVAIVITAAVATAVATAVVAAAVAAAVSHIVVTHTAVTIAAAAAAAAVAATVVTTAAVDAAALIVAVQADVCAHQDAGRAGEAGSPAPGESSHGTILRALSLKEKLFFCLHGKPLVTNSRRRETPPL